MVEELSYDVVILFMKKENIQKTKAKEELKS